MLMSPYKIKNNPIKKSTPQTRTWGLIIVIAVLFFSFVIAEISLAGPSTEVLDGFSKTGREAGYDVSATNAAPKKTFTQAWAIYTYNFAAGSGGALFMILIIYGGWLWMTAQGKEEQVERAKKIIIGATIGLGIIIGARLIAELVIEYLGIAIGIPASGQ